MQLDRMQPEEADRVAVGRWVGSELAALSHRASKRNMVAYFLLGAGVMSTGQYPTPTRYGPAYRRTGFPGWMFL